MSGWFDKHAKRSATSLPPSAAGSVGPSRRRVILGGSAAVATAWTAPMLMASSAAAVGLSACPATRIKVCTDGTQVCCPNATDTCTINSVGQPVCAAPGTPGGFCGDCGNGTCPQGYKCNGNDQQNNGAEASNVCGGEGAQCCPRNQAFGGCFGEHLTCVGVVGGDQAITGFCRKSCTSAADCRTTGVTPGSPRCPQVPSAQTCSTNTTGTRYCGKACTTDAGCTGSQICAFGTCSYNRDGNLTRTCAAP